MKLVIEMSEDDYRKVQDGRASVSMMRKAIANGTPLPKSHGRLIDYGYVVDAIDDWVNAVTQGEYTKYEDVPIAISGENPGWTVNTNNTLITNGDPNLATMVIMPNTPPIMLAKDQTYRKRDDIS